MSAGLAIGSVVLAGVGFAFGRLSVANKNDAEGIIQNELPPGNSACRNPIAAVVDPCARLHDARIAQNGYYYLSTSTYVAAGVFLTSAVATYFLWPKSPEKRAAFIPYVSVPDRSAGFQYTF